MGWLDLILTSYMAAFGLRLFLPAVSPFSGNPLMRGLYAATEPVLRPVRRLLLRGEPRFDWSPLIVILLLVVVRGVVLALVSGNSAATGVTGSALEVLRFVVNALAILFLGVFFISIDTPFGYSQIGHMMYTVAGPFLAPLRLIFRRRQGSADPAPLIGILLLGVLHGLVLLEASAYFPTAAPPDAAGAILIGMVDLLDTILDVLFLVILIRAVVSWFNPDPATPMFQVLIIYSDPILTPIQRIMPSTYGIDFSPLIAILILRFLQSSLLPLLLRI
jgi:YggT family protein